MAIQNIARGKMTGSSGCVKPYESAKAVDGLQTPINRWLCNGVNISTPAKLTVDLGGPSVITSWTVRHMGAAGWRSPDYNMGEYQLQTSMDGGAWITVSSVTNNAAAITNLNLTTLVVARYARLNVTKGLITNPQMASVVEFEVYGQRTPYLSALTVSISGTAQALTPAFAPLVFNYSTANVPNSTTSVTVVATPQDPAAGVKINGIAVTNISAGLPVSLNVGSNPIIVLVTAADGSTQNYVVTIVRNAPPVAYLTGLDLKTAAAVGVPYTPTFAQGTLAYSASVGYDVDKIVVTPTTDITGATITVNGAALVSGASTVNLAVGANTIPVVVSNGGVTKTYTVTVTRAAALTGISAMIVGGAVITLTPSTTPFNKTQLAYTGVIEYSDASFNIQNVAITPTYNSDVLVKYGSSTISSGTAVTIKPTVGDNVVKFDVSALDGTGVISYIVTITRKHSAYLSAIASSKGTVSPAMTPKGATFTYTVKAGSSESSTTITLTAEEPSATITLTLNSTTTTTTGSATQTTPVTPAVKIATVTVSSNGQSNNYTIKVSK